MAPALLTVSMGLGAVRWEPSESRRQSFTTWLGLRYDRPAVPDELDSEFEAVASELVAEYDRLWP